MGPKGKLMADTARDWVNAEARVGPWEGQWLLAHTSHLGRVDRAALRARERAFRLTGFSEFVTGLWCRPANLVESAAATRERLLALGLERDAVIMRADELPGIREQNLRRLWPARELTRAYKQQIKAMEASTRRVARLALDEAARETLIVGEGVIRQINADPLLPEEMIDTALRRDMVAGMVAYDELGRGVWAQFIEAAE